MTKAEKDVLDAQGRGRKGGYGAYYSRNKRFKDLNVDSIRRRKDRSKNKDHEFDKNKKRR